MFVQVQRVGEGNIVLGNQHWTSKGEFPHLYTVWTLCQLRCRWKGILTALATNERAIILMKKCLGL